MEESLKRLGDAELEIMQVIWSAREPLTSPAILAQLNGRRKWALSTLMTSLNRLADKGFVVCDRSGKSNLYTPLVKETDYRARESRSFLQRLHGNSVQSLVASLYDSRAIGDGDLEELRAFLDRLERKEEL